MVGRGLSSQPEQHHSCGSRARILRVALGKHNLKVWEATQQVLRVARQVPHPQYNSRTNDNDLMLLRLERPARLGRGVRPISVARSCAGVGSSCLVSGWGTISSPVGEGSCVGNEGLWAGPLGLREEGLGAWTSEYPRRSAGVESLNPDGDERRALVLWITVLGKSDALKQVSVLSSRCLSSPQS